MEGREDSGTKARPSRKTLPNPSLKQVAVLLLLSAAAVLVHGYHPYVEDAEIYVPGIKRALNADLYPYNREFFADHARLTLFPNVVAGFTRLTHLSLDWVLFGMHLFSIFLLLLACWHLGRLCFPDPQAKWGSVALVGALLTLPVAGTALYIMDQYLTARSFSTPALMFVVLDLAEKRWLRASLWALAAASIHPLMVVFGLSYGLLQLAGCRQEPGGARVGALLSAGAGLWPRPSAAYLEALDRHSYFFLLRWQWFEWVGIFAPLAVLGWFERIGRKLGLGLLASLCRAAIWFGLLYFSVGVVIGTVPGLESLAELQPMRSLQLIYILMLVFAGGLLAQFFLQRRLARWLLVFAPLCGGMFYAQRQCFPATAHLEWPGRVSGNDWVKAFVWVRDHTPRDAYFALNPDHMAMAGEDQQGFRAIAERSSLADRIKDSGAVTMFPSLADRWRRQVRSEDGWENFGEQDFRRLERDYDVGWFVLDRLPVPGMSCPYENDSLRVCRLQP
jgi:hypothetical protein